MRVTVERVDDGGRRIVVEWRSEELQELPPGLEQAMREVGQPSRVLGVLASLSRWMESERVMVQDSGVGTGDALKSSEAAVPPSTPLKKV